MKRFITAFLILACVCHIMCAKSLIKVELAQYGSLDSSQIEATLAKAVADIDGKCLILPDMPLNIGNLKIADKRNFAIKGNLRQPITCKDLRLYNCSDFDLSDLYIMGTKAKFATFYIVGDCADFTIHNCKFDSEKNAEGHNTFYGIHVIADTQRPDPSYDNSPRRFRIYDNEIRNTRYDGILAHGHCSDFVIERNTIIGAECIGIESEGRYGGATNTTVHPCKNAVIRNNLIRDCKEGWNILVMWTDNVRIYGNKCYNGWGAFLSIGCTDLEVKSNILEGRTYGFELSNEFFKISNGINDNVLIKGNIITGKARAAERGVLDIRHSQNVTVKGNKVSSIYRDNSAIISVASSKHVSIKKNRFVTDGQKLHNTILLNNVVDYETKQVVPALDVEDIEITNNTFTGSDLSVEANGISLPTVNCVIKKNKLR